MEELETQDVIENLEVPEETPIDETTPVEAAGADETPEVEAAGEENEGEENEAPEYSPNLKYKVMDKELEIPKEFQALMTDEKSEKQVRELFEKAGGLDVVKTKLADTRTERDKFAGEASAIKGSIDGLRNIYQKATSSGNLLHLDDFFERLKIPTDVVMKYALAKVQLAELPDQQRNLIQSQMQAERQAEMLNQQNQQFQQSVADQTRQVKSTQMEMALARPDISPVAQAFDARANQPGAFREAVRQHGEYMWNQGKDLSPDQAALEVIRIYGLQAQANAANGVSGETSGKKVIQRTTNTIPNVQGRSGASPLKQKPRSIEDLKKLAAEYQ